MVVGAEVGVFAIAVLWLLDGDLPGGHTLISRETFKHMDECVQAIPRYQQIVERDFGSRGIVVCVKQ